MAMGLPAPPPPHPSLPPPVFVYHLCYGSRLSGFAHTCTCLQPVLDQFQINFIVQWSKVLTDQIQHSEVPLTFLYSTTALI